MRPLEVLDVVPLDDTGVLDDRAREGVQLSDQHGCQGVRQDGVWHSLRRPLPLGNDDATAGRQTAGIMYTMAGGYDMMAVGLNAISARIFIIYETHTCMQRVVLPPENKSLASAFPDLSPSRL